MTTLSKLTLSPSSPVDLQLHTTHSDGSWTPEALLDHLRQENFSLAAITDHDRPDTVPGMQALAQEKGFPLLAAVEISSKWQNQLVDLLCFGFDPAHKALPDLAQDLLQRQKENTRAVFEQLPEKGYTLPAESLPGLLDQPNTQQPNALVALLMEQDKNLDGPSAGKLVIGLGCKYETIEPAAVVDAAHQSGGVCILAHPGRGDGFFVFDAQTLDEFRQGAPIDGIEAYYPRHTPEQTAMYQEYAQQHDLLVSAGSDSHGPEHPPIKYRAEQVRALLEWAGVQMA